MAANTSANFSPSYNVHPKFVCFQIILDVPAYFEELETWLNDVNFHNFTFAVANAQNSDNYWLSNSTRLNILRNYGRLIPETVWMQQNEPSERQKIIDDIFDNWENLVGCPPKGFFDFQPDTYTINYCETRNVTYVTGYCFDQYAVDWMTERGGWQLPYYASHEHILRPNNASSHGVVIFPHQVWDWVSSLTVSHNLHTHPLSIVYFFNGNVTSAKSYVFDLIDRSLEAEPFGFVSLQFEWGWHYENNATDYVKNWIQGLLSTRNYDFWTYEDLTQWFNNEYATTPDYHLHFVSPYDGEKIEWYYCKDFRIARTDQEVVSYVQYDKQKSDKFLTDTFTPNTTMSPHAVENSIDDSLTFEIDAIGGGEYRSPIRDSGISYSGELSEFPDYYINGAPSPTPTTSPSLSPSPTPNIPEFPSWIILSLLIIVMTGVGLLVYSKKHNH